MSLPAARRLAGRDGSGGHARVRLAAVLAAAAALAAAPGPAGAGGGHDLGYQVAAHAAKAGTRVPAAAVPDHWYVVRDGDTLWGIAAEFLGGGPRWPGLYAANRAVIGPDPDLIYPGQRYRLTTAADTVTVRARRSLRAPPGPAPHGTLSCAGLERLWQVAGGPRWTAFLAAEIAQAESSGRQYATGPAGERGYWQISPGHGALSTYDAYGNARAAVIISSWGRDWSPWTTWTSGAYRGRC